MYYWVDKYTLLRKSTLRRSFWKICTYWHEAPRSYTIAQGRWELIFDIQLRHKTGLASSIVMVCIGFIYFVLPVDKLINLINP